MKFANRTSLLLALVASGLAAANPPQHFRRAENSTGLPARTIFQFSQTGTWLENIAVRPNGDLVMTMLTPSASLWTLRQPYSLRPEAAQLHEFAGATGLVGVAETRPDTFVVLAARFEGAGEPAPGSFAVWEISLRNGTAVRKVIDFAEAQLANGIAAVPGCGGGNNNDVVLIGDSFAGSLWRLDTRTGAYERVLQVAQMAAPSGAEHSLGINGVKVRDGFVYWSNSARASIYRTRITSGGYPVPSAAVETVAALDSPFVDDFAFDAQGLLWAATNADNRVVVVRADGSYETAVGGAAEDAVAGDAAVAFGRTPRDRETLYVVTSGTLPNNRTEPAKVVAVDRAGFPLGSL
ncbi:hypothetical protein AAE478_002612 [Parahypoxylon ruwenzoriense]